MKQYKANWRYYFFIVFFSAIVLLGLKVVIMLLNGEVSDHEEEMSKGMSILLAIMICLVLLTYMLSVFALLKQLLKYHGTVLNITSNGIEDTLVFINLFAFVIVFPVKLIPWETVIYCDSEQDKPYIRVNTKLVQAGFFAKLILAILGYQFGIPFVKPQVRAEDIMQYQYRWNLTNVE